MQGLNGTDNGWLSIQKEGCTRKGLNRSLLLLTLSCLLRCSWRVGNPPLTHTWVRPRSFGQLKNENCGAIFWNMYVVFVDILGVLYNGHICGLHTVSFFLFIFYFYLVITTTTSPLSGGLGRSECRPPYLCKYHYSQRGRFQKTHKIF